MNKEECESACLYLLGHCYEEKEIKDGIYEFKPSGFKESEIFKELINKYFELKEKLEKNCLVSNMARDIEKLEKALDKACKELYDHQMSEAGIDEELHGIHPNFINAEEWKEWCMKGD